VADSKLSPLLVIVGETASGKSALGLKLAKHFNGEIICGDAWTLRREADIGTAKPTREERSEIAHHLLDVIGPQESFSAASWQKLAREAMEDITGRGKLPILVGGSGLYIDSLLYNYSFRATKDMSSRELLNGLTREQLLERLNLLDIDTSDVDTHNKRRLIRLVETKGQKSTSQQLRDNTLAIGLRVDRQVLRKRITSRLDNMLSAGLEQEVSSLVKRYGWQCEALKGISYAEWHDYFLGQETLENVRSKIIKANLDLAKRQRTWFKRNKSIHWLDTPVNWQEIVELVTTYFNF
jgi:tRNA dimethylallyltransferase